MIRPSEPGDWQNSEGEGSVTFWISPRRISATTEQVLAVIGGHGSATVVSDNESAKDVILDDLRTDTSHGLGPLEVFQTGDRVSIRPV